MLSLTHRVAGSESDAHGHMETDCASVYDGGAQMMCEAHEHYCSPESVHKIQQKLMVAAGVFFGNRVSPHLEVTGYWSKNELGTSP